MSETTIAKLVMAQRDRELRAEQHWSVADLVGLPLVAIILFLGATAGFTWTAERGLLRELVEQVRRGGLRASVSPPDEIVAPPA